MATRATTANSKTLSLSLPLDACDKMLGRVFTEIGATHVHRTRSSGQVSYAGRLSVEGQDVEVTVTESAPGQCQLQFSSRAATGMLDVPAESGARALEVLERALKRQAGSALKA